MRWQTYKKPIVGDVRRVKRFALLPRRVGSDNRVWLEHYWSVQEYKRKIEWTYDEYGPHSWTVTKWVEVGSELFNE